MLFIFYNQINAQTIEFGQGVKIKNKNNYSLIIGSNEVGSFVLRAKDYNFKRDVLIEKYNSKLALEISKEIPLSIPANIEKTILIGQNIIVIVSAKNNATNKIDFLALKLDMNLNQTGNMAMLASIDESLINENSTTAFKNSINNKYFSLSILCKTGRKSSTTSLFLYGFNESLTQIYGKVFEINELIEDIETTNCELDNEGNFFTLLDFPKINKKKRKNENRKFVLYSYFNATSTMLEFDVAKPNIEIDDIGFVINNLKKQVNIIGFYAEENELNNIGYFFQTIDISSATNTKNILDTTSLKVLRNNISFSKNLDLNDIYIRKIIPRSDGGLFLVAEKYFLTRQSYTYYVNGFPQTNTRTVYNYNDVLLLSLNADGLMENGDIVNKEQQTVSDGGFFSSITNFVSNDAIYTIYNADVTQEGDVLLCKFDVKGKTENKILVKAINASLLIIPQDSKQISATSLLACAIRDKRFTLMRINF
ncbi:MAG: hypothetical protein WCI53_04760 [Bacteroidota bacterium]